MSAVDIRSESGLTRQPTDLRGFMEEREREGRLLRVPFEIDTLDDTGA